MKLLVLDDVEKARLIDRADMLKISRLSLRKQYVWVRILP